MELDARAARLARRQRGLLSHEQALALGYSRQAIRTKLARATWAEIRPGVYVIGGVPSSWEQTLLAVTLPFDDCWLSHGTAAKFWESRFAPQIDAIEVLRPYGRYRRLDGVLAHRSRIITPADVTVHRGIAVTSRARTIVECSGRLTPAQAGKLIDDALRKDKRALEDVRACFARLAAGGRRRKRSIRAALTYRIPGYDPGESDLELNTLRVIIAAGLPIPVQQFRVVINGRRCRIDLAYPERKIAIELQSWDWHGGRESFDDDKARSAELTALGWRVLEVTSRHSAEDVIRWIRSTMALVA
jgi:hypothetical protein